MEWLTKWNADNSGEVKGSDVRIFASELRDKGEYEAARQIYLGMRRADAGLGAP